MKTEQILMCIVALILGMLLFHMLKGVCGCKIVEGNAFGNAFDSATNFAKDKVATFKNEPTFDKVRDIGTLVQSTQGPQGFAGVPKELATDTLTSYGLKKSGLNTRYGKAGDLVIDGLAHAGVELAGEVEV